VADWDAAFLNDRYVDLAIPAIFFVANESEEQMLLSAYFGGDLNAYHGARFFIMRQIGRMIYAIIMFRLACAANPAGLPDDPDMSTMTLRKAGGQMAAGELSLSSYRGQLLYGKALLNEALIDLRSQRFTRSMALLAEG